jgi:hypothetical protein
MMGAIGAASIPRAMCGRLRIHSIIWFDEETIGTSSQS